LDPLTPLKARSNGEGVVSVPTAVVVADFYSKALVAKDVDFFNGLGFG
jgi:hypothetical protein